MNETTWWYLSRASGIVAMVLLVFSVLWGVMLSTRALKPHDRPAWLLEVHKWLGGTALAMTALHLIGLALDGYVDFGPSELFVPGASSYRTLAVAIGVVSLYVMIAVQATSYMRRWLSRRAWHRIHLLSYVLVWTTAIHAGLAGTDTVNRAYQALALLLTMIAVAATMVRILQPAREDRSAAARRRGPTAASEPSRLPG